ncbi:MAG: hypothetical protein JF616_07470 [Fibrobacteres bacterium]|nr:hypothetical protein [Fibrobacterota bacterium]
MVRLGGLLASILMAAAPGRADWKRSDVPEAEYFYSFAVSGKSIFAATVGGLFRSDDTGNTWTHITNLGLDNTVNSVAANGSGVYAAVVAWKVLRTQDNGETWTDASAGLPTSVFPILGVGANTLFVATDDSGVFRSPDNGRSWTPINNGLTLKRVSSFLVNGSILIAGTLNAPGSMGSIFRSGDGGDSWTEMNDSLAVGRSQNLAMSGSQLFAAGFRYNDGIYRSRDNGLTWTLINNGLTQPDVYSLLASGPYLFAGATGGVFCSRNGGDNWTRIDNGSIKGDLYSMMVYDSTLFVGARGEVWKLRLSELPTDLRPSSRQPETGFPLGSLFHPGDRVSFFLRNRAEISLSLCDVRGKESVLLRGAFDKGGHSARLREDLPKGVYYLRLTAGGESRTRSLAVY